MSQLFVACSALAFQPSAPLPRVAPLPRAAVAAPPPALAAALAAFGGAAAVRADWWVEINKPPIELSPFHINPVGYSLILGYIAYLSWQILRPATEAEQKVAARNEEAAARAAELSVGFLQARADEEGAIRTGSGLVYRELAAGSGAAPTVDNVVKVHYVGTLADGDEFDSSIARGEPTEFKLNQVIPGWQEGLQLMKPGGKALLSIPAELGYGEMGVPGGKIPGRAALSFEVELLEVKEGGFRLPF